MLNVPASLFTKVGAYEVMRTNLTNLPVEILPETSILVPASGNSVNTLGTFAPNLSSQSTFSMSAEVTKASWATPVADVVLASYLDGAGENGIRVWQESTDGKLYVEFLNGAAQTFVSTGYDITGSATGAHQIGIVRVAATRQKVYWDGALVASSTDATDVIGTPTAVTKNISAISLADPAKITTSAVHGLTSGDLVTLSAIVGSQTMNRRKNKGMISMNGKTYEVTVVDTTKFTINVDASNFDAYVSSGVMTYNPEQTLAVYTGTTNELVTLNEITADDMGILYNLVRNNLTVRDENGSIKTVTLS